MAEKQENSHSCESRNCSSKFVYPVSVVSLMICIVAMVRIEIVNQRVHVVEDFMAKIKQTPNMEAASDVTSFKSVEQVKSVDEFNHKDTGESEKDAIAGKLRFIVFEHMFPHIHLHYGRFCYLQTTTEDKRVLRKNVRMSGLIFRPISSTDSATKVRTTLYRIINLIKGKRTVC